MKINVITIILIVLTLSIDGYAGRRLTEKDRDNPIPSSLSANLTCMDSLQHQLIRKALETKSDTLSYDWLAALSLHSFDAWLQRVMCQECELVVFNIPEPDINLESDQLWEHKLGYRLGESLVDSQTVALNMEYLEALPFEAVPQYECCDYATLLSGKCIPLYIKVNNIKVMGFGVRIYIGALIPEKFGSSTFIPVNFGYFYSLLLNYKDGAKTPYERISKLNSMLNNGEISSDEWMRMYQEMPIFKWILEDIEQYNYDSITFNAENMPKSVFELFGAFPDVQRIKKEIEYNPLDKFDPNDDSDDEEDN